MNWIGKTPKIKEKEGGRDQGCESNCKEEGGREPSKAGLFIMEW